MINQSLEGMFVDNYQQVQCNNVYKLYKYTGYIVYVLHVQYMYVHNIKYKM